MAKKLIGRELLDVPEREPLVGQPQRRNLPRPRARNQPHGPDPFSSDARSAHISAGAKGPSNRPCDMVHPVSNLEFSEYCEQQCQQLHGALEQARAMGSQESRGLRLVTKSAPEMQQLVLLLLEESEHLEYQLGWRDQHGQWWLRQRPEPTDVPLRDPRVRIIGWWPLPTYYGGLDNMVRP